MFLFYSLLTCFKIHSFSDLKREVQRREDSLLKGKISGRIKVLEKLGPTIRDTLSNPNPWNGSHCGRLECQPCKTKEGSCRQKNVLYTISCLTCLQSGHRSVYHGESSRTLYERSWEHWDGLRQKTEESVLSRHWREHHSDQETEPEFSVKLVGKCRTSTERQIKESLLIDKEDPKSLINNKSEWGQNPVPRQATEFRDRVWEDRQRPETDNMTDIPDSVTVKRETRQQTETISVFETQLSQRRKVIRETKREESERQNLIFATEIPDANRGIKSVQKRLRATVDPNSQTEASPGVKQQRKRQRHNVTEVCELQSRDLQRNIRDMFTSLKP